jgi:hypothetical protein
MKRTPGFRLICMALMLTGFISCQKELRFDAEPVKDHNLVLQFVPVVQYDSNKLEIGKTYNNFFGQPFKVDNFKFYINSIKLINVDSGKVFEISDDKYFLVDCTNPDTVKARIQISVLPFKYNRIAFTIGVDSARNVSGAQTGALDPALGMFWTWNTGYVMAKLEGTSPTSTAPGNRFEYHIGGFKEPDNVIKEVTLLFPFGQDVDLQPGKTTEMTIAADVYDWFYNPHDIRLDVVSFIHSPGPLAKSVSENYSKMFTVVGIVNEP